MSYIVAVRHKDGKKNLLHIDNADNCEHAKRFVKSAMKTAKTVLVLVNKARYENVEPELA